MTLDRWSPAGRGLGRIWGWLVLLLMAGSLLVLAWVVKACTAP